MVFSYRYDVDSLTPAFQPFRFNGGALPLHLVETVHEWDGDCIDRIGDRSDWNDWLIAADQTVPDEDIDDDGLADMRELREAIVLITRAIVAGRQATDDSLTSVNRFAGRALPTPLLARGPRGLVAVTSAALTHQDVLTRIAIDAVELFSGPRASRIRVCAEPTCPTLFVDNSQSGTKVWCSTACGTRAAARAYRGRRARAAVSAADR